MPVRQSRSLALAILSSTWLAAAGSADCTRQEVHPATPQDGALFGEAVDIHANGWNIAVAVVGSPGATVAGQTGAGEACVWRLVAGVWEEEATLLPPDPGTDHRFGASVAIFEDVAVVGSPGHSLAAPQAGVVDIFRFDGSSWVYETRLQRPTPVAGDLLGCAVALDAGTLVVGLEGADAAAVDAGGAVVYRDDGGVWTYVVALPNWSVSGAGNGHAVDLDGDHLIVGAPGDEVGGVRCGSALVYERNGMTWTYRDRLSPPAPVDDQRFGTDVTVSNQWGVHAAVGAPGTNSAGPDSGAVHAFTFASGAWSHRQVVIPADAQAGGAFGSAVTLDDLSLIIGSAGFDGSSADSGKLYAYWGDPGIYGLFDSFEHNGAAPGDGLGGDVASAPGTGWILGGAPRHDDRALDGGVVHFTIPAVGACTIGALCAGDGGMTPCPCGNESTGDEGCRNSTHRGAAVRALGGTSASADDLVLFGTDLVPGQAALLFVGNNSLNGDAGLPFGDGLRCVGGGIIRLGVQLPDGYGDAWWGPGLGAVGGWSGGDLKYFQLWYRDPGSSPCGHEFNLSDAMAVGFY